MTGKEIRLERILNRNTGKTVIIPMDHGVTSGPIPGLINIAKTINKVSEGGANAVVIHNGLVSQGHRRYGRDIGLIIHLSASTSLGPDPNNKVLIFSVVQALKHGADGVSIHINIGAENEANMLSDFGKVSQDCKDWGIPLLAMIYPRGPGINNPKGVEEVKLAARLGAELGADLVKVPYTGSPESFKKVVVGCPIPVVIAGGSKLSDQETLKMIEGAIKAGAAGLSMGRNTFQHKHPEKLVRAACEIVHGKKTAKEAIKLLK